MSPHASQDSGRSPQTVRPFDGKGQHARKEVGPAWWRHPKRCLKDHPLGDGGLARLQLQPWWGKRPPGTNWALGHWPSKSLSAGDVLRLLVRKLHQAHEDVPLTRGAPSSPPLVSRLGRA